MSDALMEVDPMEVDPIETYARKLDRIFKVHPDWYALLLEYVRSDPMFFRTPQWRMTYGTKLFMRMPVEHSKYRLSEDYQPQFEARVSAVLDGLQAGIGENPDGELDDVFEVEYVNGCSEAVYLPKTFPQTRKFKIISKLMSVRDQKPEPIYAVDFHNFLLWCLKADLQVTDGVSSLYRFWNDSYQFAKKQQNRALVDRCRKNVKILIDYFGEPNGETYNTMIEYFREKPTPDRFFDVVYNLFMFVSVFKYSRRPHWYYGELTKFTVAEAVVRASAATRD